MLFSFESFRIRNSETNAADVSGFVLVAVDRLMAMATFVVVVVVVVARFLIKGG